MGVGYHGLQFALLAERRKADFSRTITLGRQHHYLNPVALRAMFERFGLALTPQDERSIFKDDYAEGLFRTLGASTVDSMDASDYQGANVIHDLNLPLPRSLVRRYTCVVDFGTLEHVFNFPVALKSATDMVEVGGHFMCITVANNFMGHGFYQFSPELFIGYLSANGFADIEIYLAPYRDWPYFFRVTDPQVLSGRVELVNSERVQMCVLARKERHLPEMVTPIQSDYVQQAWQGRDVEERSLPPAVDSAVAATVLDLRQRASWLLMWPETVSPALVHGFENGLHYRLVDPAKL